MENFSENKAIVTLTYSQLTHFNSHSLFKDILKDVEINIMQRMITEQHNHNEVHVMRTYSFILCYSIPAPWHHFYTFMLSSNEDRG